jgi:NitT/TauT family transport system substrate-binding protein
MRRRSVVSPTVLAAALVAAGPAVAAEEIDIVLNWVAGGDHAPYYYAKEMGWYEDAGLEVNIEQGKGSAAAVQKVAAGAADLGLADMGTVLVAAGKGADVKAVMNVYANSPYGLYWLKSSGIAGIEDMPGKKIGNPPGDAARAMFPALAKAAGIDPDSVTWVNIAPNAKLAALKARSIDATTSFYNIHHIFKRELGDDMGFLAWKDLGVNPYGNSIIVNGDYFKDDPETVRRFVEVTQGAFSACVEEPEPCVQALVEANTGLQFENELENWHLVTELMSDETSRNVGLGFFDPERMRNDYELVETYFTIEQPFDVESVYTNEFLDPKYKMKEVRGAGAG